MRYGVRIMSVAGVRGRGQSIAILLAVVLGLVAIVLGEGAHAYANGFVITPTFDGSITGNANDAQIEGAINTAVTTVEGLFSNSVDIPVTFTYKPGAAGNLLSTNQFYFAETYSDYKRLLQADSTANPGNTVLATALANLPSGNNANGNSGMAIVGGQLTMLGVAAAGQAVININSNQTFAFSRPVSGSQFDLVGGLEHELNEVLGGGGAGSTLNSIAGSCINNPSGFFCSKYGSTDLYRYSTVNIPSFTTSLNATSYLSVDGGATKIVNFNQNSNGDYGDFAPPGSGAGQLIQNAFNSTGQDEAYTSSSPEFLMLEATGWNSSAAAATPEPSSLILFGIGLAGIAAYKRSKIGLSELILVQARRMIRTTSSDIRA